MNIEQRFTLNTEQRLTLVIESVESLVGILEDVIAKQDVLTGRLDTLEARQDLSRYAPSRSFLGGKS